MKVILLYTVDDYDQDRVQHVLVKDEDFSEDELYKEFEDSMREVGMTAKMEWQAAGKRGHFSNKFREDIRKRLGKPASYYDFLVSKGFREIEFATNFI